MINSSWVGNDGSARANLGNIERRHARSQDRVLIPDQRRRQDAACRQGIRSRPEHEWASCPGVLRRFLKALIDRSVSWWNGLRRFKRHGILAHHHCNRHQPRHDVCVARKSAGLHARLHVGHGSARRPLRNRSLRKGGSALDPGLRRSIQSRPLLLKTVVALRINNGSGAFSLFCVDDF